MSGDGVTRRGILAAAAGAIAVGGYDMLARRWIAVAEAASCEDPFGAPRLDGTLLLDPAARAAAGTDRGNLVVRSPAAVLRPGSVRDIQAMVRFCGRCGSGTPTAASTTRCSARA